MMIEHADLARKLMNDHGYGDAESVFDEWNYMRDWSDQFDSYPKIKNHVGAAYCAAVLCAMQTKTDIDVAAYFEADVVKEWCGIFEVKNMAIAKQRAELGPLKPFYAFKCFNALYNMKDEKAVECDGDGIYTLAASDEKSCGLLISNYSENDAECKLLLEGIPTETVEVRITDKDRTFEKLFSFKCKDRIEYTMNIGSNTFVYFGTPII